MSSFLSNDYTEVECVLNKLGKNYIDKIPEDVLKTIRENRNQHYTYDVDLNNLKIGHNISRNALSILAILYLRYWEEDPDNILELKDKFIKNEQEYRRKINKNTELINTRRFNNHSNNNQFNKVQETALIEVKDNFWTKVRGFFKKMFINESEK